MFQKEKGAEGIDLERLEGMLVVDLRRGFLRAKDTGKAKCEAQMIGGGRKAGFAVGGSGRYGGFI